MNPNMVAGLPQVASIPFGNVKLLKDWLIKTEYIHPRWLRNMDYLINQGMVQLIPPSGLSTTLVYRVSAIGNDEPMTNEIVIAQRCIPSIMSIKITKKLQIIGIEFFKKYGNSWNGGFYLNNMEALQGLEYKV